MAVPHGAIGYLRSLKDRLHSHLSRGASLVIGERVLDCLGVNGGVLGH